MSVCKESLPYPNTWILGDEEESMKDLTNLIWNAKNSKLIVNYGKFQSVYIKFHYLKRIISHLGLQDVVHLPTWMWLAVSGNGKDLKIS